MIGQIVIMNIYYYKVIKLDIPLFWKNIGKMSVIPVIMVSVGMWISATLEPMPWGVLILGILIYTAIYSAGMYFFAMNDYEKDVVRKPVLKVFEKIKTRKL